MNARPLLVLVGNDLALHGRSLAAAHAGAVAMLAAGAWLAPARPEGALVSLVFNVNVLGTLVWADWLVSREKTKGTVAWLRTLPIPDHALVGAKFCTHALCCVSCWLATSLPFAYGHFFPGRAGTWGVLMLALVTFGGVSVATRWRFPQKLGHVLPPLVVLALVMPVMVAQRAGVDVEAGFAPFWGHWSGRAVVAAVLATLYGSLEWATIWWVARSDTPRLVE